MKIITIHGIRRNIKWYEKLKDLDGWNKTSIEIINFEYGYFTFGSFINPLGRKRAVREFLDFYSKNIKAEERPSVIAHSFGSYILIKSLKKYSVIKVDKVILCGSILSQNTDWETLFKNGQIRHLFNDIGENDLAVRFSRVVSPFTCGPSGQKGFNIPKELNNVVTQKFSEFDHSDSFFVLNMNDVWIPFILRDVRKFTYDEKILSRSIIERMYNTQIAIGLKIREAKFIARIDSGSNYFANYTISVINSSNDKLESIDISMAADSVLLANSTEFKSFDQNGIKLKYETVEDSKQHKHFRVFLDKPIAINDEVRVNYLFKWSQTMSLKGDIDHWLIGNIDRVKVHLNFEFRPLDCRFYALKAKQVIEEFEVEHKREIDGSNSYSIDLINSNKYDALVFYYGGSNETVYNVPGIIQKKLNGEKYILRKCEDRYTKEITSIEQEVEEEIPASDKTIRERMRLFNDGFLVVTDSNDRVVGYAQSIIWDITEFDSFEDIKDFSRYFYINGKHLYIIFITVKESFRKKGIASWMIDELKNVASRYQVDAITLVAKSHLEDWYHSKGFNRIKYLPNYLPGKNYKAVYMKNDLVK